jgi:hypothetical protein
MSEHEHLSLGGQRYVVRPCTEKPGLWIEVYNAPQTGRDGDNLVRVMAILDDEIDEKMKLLGPEIYGAYRERQSHQSAKDEGEEPYRYFFIPAEIRHAIADSLRTDHPDILEEDDDE